MKKITVLSLSLLICLSLISFNNVLAKEYATTSITLTVEEDGTSGSASIGEGEKCLRVFNEAKATEEHYHISGYYLTNSISGTKVIDEDGNLVKDVAEYTDSEGNWICTSESLTLYGIAVEDTCTITYVSNVPANASTQLTGSMAPVTVSYSAENVTLKNIYDSGCFHLPGYYFKCWNTKADGTGDSYTNRYMFAGALNKEELTLYAQWEPLYYYVVFDGNGSTSGAMNNMQLYFDETKQLSDNLYSETDYCFTNWQDGNNTYKNAAEIENLISADALSSQWENAYATAYNASQGVEPTVATIISEYETAQLPDIRAIDKKLVACWTENSDFVICVTKDYVPQSGMKIELKNSSVTLTNNYSSTNPDSKTGSDGKIYFPYSTAGTYDIFIDNTDSGRDVTFDGLTVPEAVFLDYFTFDAVGKDSNIVDVSLEGIPASPIENTILQGTELTAKAENIADYYQFKTWKSNKTDPTFANKNSDTTTLTVNGPLSLTATSEPIPVSYTIEFNNNGGEGEMASLTCENGKSFNLPVCEFKKDYYVFTGWNTKTDGSGISYIDEALIETALTMTDGDTVTLYAQYKPIEYIITYNLNDGSNDLNNPSTYTMEEAVTLKDASKKNFAFEGWYKESAFVNRVESIAKGSMGNLDLYAKFVPNPIINADKSNVIINPEDYCKLSKTFEIGAAKDIVIDVDDTYSSECKAELLDLNGNKVTDCICSEGSIKVSIQKSFLNTLSAGTHKYALSVTNAAKLSYVYELTINVNNLPSANEYRVVNTGVNGTGNSLLKLVSLLSLTAITGVVALKKRKH